MSTIVETNFFGDLEQVEKPQVSIIPVPYEYTTTHIKGIKEAPQAILNASKFISSFDEELWADVSKIGINTQESLTCKFVSDNSKQPFYELEKVVRTTVIGGALPIIIGGENSITYGALRALYDLYPDISILHFDSRPDLKTKINDNRFHHLCFMKSILQEMPDIKLVQVGIKSISKEEKDWIEEKGSNIDMYFAREKKTWDINEILSSLTRNVYISFDFSVLDSMLMPACTYPEPGGIGWEGTLNLLKNICAFKEVVGMDFVQFSPIENFHSPNATAAKLIYKSIGYTFAKELGALDDEEVSVIR